MTALAICLVDTLVRHVQDGDQIPFNPYTPEGRIDLVRWLSLVPVDDGEATQIVQALTGIQLAARPLRHGLACQLLALPRCVEHSDCRDHPELGRACLSAR